jgi:ribosomal protein S18 acetylase RimI-like enzyme
MSNVSKKLRYASLETQDIPLIVAAFTEIGWDKPESIYQQYLKEQENNQRCIWVARNGNNFVGYVTLKWHSDYQPFASQSIPEINDLNVFPRFRQQGIGSWLLDMAEAEASKISPCVGIGVGLYADYGNAQKLYVKRGYVPDGGGVTYKNKLVEPGDTVRVDDDLVLWLIKKVRTNTTKVLL